MLSYLDSRWLLLMEGLGMHKMGRKLMIFAFFFDSRGAFQMDTPGLTGFSGSEEHQNILWECMHERVGGEKLYIWDC
jgi:hypothetical protein